jgi:hypothetical protein
MIKLVVSKMRVAKGRNSGVGRKPLPLLHQQLRLAHMHRALKIVEVVEMICGQLDAQLDNPLSNRWYQHASRSSLARLARTSTTFLDPALNVLWRHQGTLVHLLKCMPSDVWDIDIPETRDDEDDVILIDVKIVRFVGGARFLK